MYFSSQHQCFLGMSAVTFITVYLETVRALVIFFCRFGFSPFSIKNSLIKKTHISNRNISPLQEGCPEFACSDWYCATCFLAAASWILNLMPAYCLLPLPQRAILRHVKCVQWPKAVLMMLMLLVFSEVNAHVRLERPEVHLQEFLLQIYNFPYRMWSVCTELRSTDFHRTPPTNERLGMHLIYDAINIK